MAVVVVVATLVGCTGPINPRLATYDTAGGYRYANVCAEGPEEELFVILASSGGGTRAAAFSYGLLKGLRPCGTSRPPAPSARCSTTST